MDLSLNTQNRLKDFLEEKVTEYNRPAFLEEDPLQIPHLFSKKEDIEISAFFTASFAWGLRKTIINKSLDLMKRMDHAPHDFICNYSENDLKSLLGFKHRTFNSDDLLFFVEALKKIYSEYKTLEELFKIREKEGDTEAAIERFRTYFLTNPHLKRSEKHISSPTKGSSAKRLNMFLRWMVRDDKNGVDFGIWKEIPTSKLSCPLDVHSGNVARNFGLLKRKQNDQKAVKELDAQLRFLDAKDPVKYDFALFGLGVYEGIINLK